MYFCYIDEAGCTGNLYSYTTNVQPVFVLCGLIVPERALLTLTQDFLALKRRFNPSLAQTLNHDLDIVKHEIKGAEDLRKPIRRNNRNNKRRAIGFLDKTLSLLEKYNCKIVSNIYVKNPTVSFNGFSLYARSVQFVNDHFQVFLQQENNKGVVIADSRNYQLNVRVSHSIFTQKFKSKGDAYPSIVEMPVFGHSDNHAAIQITDILCSALLFPITTYVYCTGHISSVHVDSRFNILQTRYAERLKTMSFRYSDGQRYRGGITVFDTLEKRSANHFFIPSRQEHLSI